MALHHSLDSLVGALFVNEPGSNKLRILLTLLDEGTLDDEVAFFLQHMTNTSKSWAMDGRLVMIYLTSLSGSESELCLCCRPQWGQMNLVLMQEKYHGRIYAT